MHWRQAQADKVAAQAEVDKLANSSVKDSLQGRLNNFVDPSIPAINDADNNGTPDTQDQSNAAAALAAVEKAEQAYQTLPTEIGNAQQDGLINPAEHQAMLNALAQAQTDKDRCPSRSGQAGQQLQ